MGKYVDPVSPSTVIHTFEIGITKENILNDFDWRNLRLEIMSLPPIIDIIPHIITFMECVNRIHTKTINDLFNTLYEDAKNILSIQGKFSNNNGEPVVFSYEGDIHNLAELHHISIPISLAKSIIHKEQ